MKKFLFFYSKAKFKILPHENLSQGEINKMKRKGFDYREIEADDEEDVILKIKEENNINMKSLKEYGGDITFSSLIESLLR